MQKLRACRPDERKHSRHISQVPAHESELDGWTGQRHIVSVAGMQALDKGERMSDTFLSAEEVAELTGIMVGRRGKTREELQVEWLRTSGIPFWTNARGRPIIARAAIVGREAAEQPKKKWQPKVMAFG